MILFLSEKFTLLHVLTSTSLKKKGLSTGDAATLYNEYNNALINIKFDEESNEIATTSTFTEHVQSKKTVDSFKFPDYNSGKLEVQLLLHSTTFTTAIVLNQITTSAVELNQIFPVVDVSATIGSIGAEACYETSSSKVTNCSLGINFTKKDACASIILGDNKDTIKASYVHHLDSLKRSAAIGEISRRFSTNENTFTVGGLYAVDNLTTIKAKINNHGKLGVFLQHEVIPKSLLSLASEIDTKALDKTPRFGLALVLKP
ncbi:hypothetical protein AgCh_011032 [Apium graveolens]